MPAILPPEPEIAPSSRVLPNVTAAEWTAIIARLRQHLGWPTGAWQRLSMGKNPVFANGEGLILKLIPPVWREDAQREIAALAVIPPGGPVATPTLLKQAEVDGWTVFLMPALPGTTLGDFYSKLDSSDRAWFARQTGELAAWLQSVPVPDGSPLEFDWPRLLKSQAEEVLPELVKRNASARLQETWPDFLSSVGPLPTPGAAKVLLHGDLSAGNLLVQEQGGRLKITGLLDFGDASRGQATHEWISPIMNNYQGDPQVLSAFCDGYGLSPADRTPTFRNSILACCVLWYSWGYLIHQFPHLREATSWDEVAAVVVPI